ncbi:MAG: hypothetical protein ACR2MY_14405 [Candidatus Dormibacteria bacterium]
MIERAFIHIGGPAGSGKTTLVEAILAASSETILVARCSRDDGLRKARESSPKGHKELRRYQRSGADAAARFTFPASDFGTDVFYETDLMSEYSAAVIVEGDNPLEYVDLKVFVASPPPTAETLFVRRRRDLAVAERAKADAWESLLREPDGVARWMDEVVGLPVPAYLGKNPAFAQDLRTKMLAGIAAARKAPPRQPVEEWAVAERYRGIEYAGLVVVNIHREGERSSADELVADVARLRQDEALFKDILSFRGDRVPVTAVVANLADPKDAGLKKALSRTRRVIRSRSTPDRAR